ncbi:AEC family transporter [Paraburkholderia sp. RL18-103-BIB-C]|uniref:AEC family transporter n=1 Tax=unclassified Paraburkholderia TaxID=2615204 RepID=UPI0038B6CAA0
MTQTILAALLPVVFVVALGVLAARFRIIEKSSAPIFADFVVRFALPLALLGGVLKISPAAIENGPYLLSMLLGLMVPYAIAFGIGKLVFRHGLSESALQALVCAFPSMAYSGLPVLEAVVGQQGVLAVVVGNLVTSVIMIPLTLVLVQIGLGGGKAGQNAGALVAHSLLDAIKQPVVWLPIIGAIIALFGVHTPKVLELSFNLIGQAAAGVALFTLGLILYGQRLSMDRDIALNALMKNVGQPAVLFGLTMLFGIHGAPARELFLTGAIPTATAASMLALRYRTYADEAAASTLVGTVGSIVTITVAIILAAHLN